jgi:hypothetical protein
MTEFYFLTNKQKLEAGVDSVYFQISCEHIAINIREKRGKEEHSYIFYYICRKIYCLSC